MVFLYQSGKLMSNNYQNILFCKTNHLLHRDNYLSKHPLFGRDNAAAAKSLQSCLTLCNPIDGSPSESPVPGILQARTLEWVAISFSNA